jgi:hypothetical protein
MEHHELIEVATCETEATWAVWWRNNVDLIGGGRAEVSVGLRRILGELKIGNHPKSTWDLEVHMPIGG